MHIRPHCFHPDINRRVSWIVFWSNRISIFNQKALIVSYHSICFIIRIRNNTESRACVLAFSFPTFFAACLHHWWLIRNLLFRFWQPPTHVKQLFSFHAPHVHDRRSLAALLPFARVPSHTRKAKQISLSRNRIRPTISRSRSPTKKWHDFFFFAFQLGLPN